MEGGKALPTPVAGDLRELLIAASLCNNSRLLAPNTESSSWRVLGDPTEGALRVACLKGGIDPEREAQLSPRLHELPFDSRRKRMSTIHRRWNPKAPDGPPVTYVKGAPREVLALCTRIRLQGQDRPLDENLTGEVLGTNDGYAAGGLRVLGVAMRPIPDGEDWHSPEAVERDLVFLGLVAMMDPPRPEVTEAVQKCHHAGIRIIMITGDYGLTAESIARRIGIIRDKKPRIITGAELEVMDDPALKEVLREEVIFARVAPEHKLRVVTALQEQGDVVAVTGDGVNDAPSLRKADIGVAMGIAGTDVAKEAADMILTDDNFASIVNAVEEGRAVYANIKKFITYIFTSNTPEAVPFILFALSRARIPLALTVMEVLSIDLGTDMVPALALGVEPPELGLMDHPPRNLKEHVISRSLLFRSYAFLGLIQGVAAMAAFYFMYWTNGHWGQWADLPSTGALYHAATAMALGAVVTTQIGNLFAQRTERESFFRTPLFNNRFLWVGILSELAIVTLLIYLPLFQPVFGTAAFPVGNWFFLFALTPTLLLADEVRKMLVRRKERQAIINPPSSTGNV
jgi:magnesium-transporting ATPase (P-type)